MIMNVSARQKLVKVVDNPDLARGENNAVLNINKRDLEAYRTRRAQKRMFEETISDINNLKTEVSEIKSMLGTIIGALNGKNS